MGGFKDIFKTLEDNAQKMANGEAVDTDALPSFGNDDETVDEDYQLTFDNLKSKNPTRWEKAVLAMHGMVKQVSKVDPDGLDIVCFGGGKDDSSKSSISIYRNVKNVKDVEKMVTSRLPSGPCEMGKAMDFILKEAFDKGFRKRPCGILVLTAGAPDDAERLEQTLKEASERIARSGYKEPPISVTFVHVGDDAAAEDYVQHLANNIQSDKKSKKTGEVVDIVDTIKDKDIQAAMKEIRGTQSTGKNGAIIGAFAGAALGMGGLYLYNKQQAKKRKEGWSGKWKATYDGCELATLKVKDDKKGNLQIKGFPGGKTTGKYAEMRHSYLITFRDADEHWKIHGEIEDEHTIYWSDGTVWTEIPPKGDKWQYYAGAAAAGAATGGAIGYLLDKKFFKKCATKDECDYIIMVDRSAMMAVQDERNIDLDEIEEYKPGEEPSFIQQTTQKFNNLSTGEKVAVGVAGVAAVGAVAAAGVGIAHAVKAGKEDSSRDAPVAKARAIDSDRGAPASASPKKNKYRGGLNGKWRSTFEGDTLAVLDVEDDLRGNLVISGFFGSSTTGNYRRNTVHRVEQISFIDADEQWAVTGTVKGDRETVILWSDDTRWDKIAQ